MRDETQDGALKNGLAVNPARPHGPDINMLVDQIDAKRRAREKLDRPAETLQSCIFPHFK